MSSAVSGPSFSRADILPALKALAWSSLPIITDQLAQRIFFKKVALNRNIDLTLPGLFTCIVVVYFLPSSSPARVGAPILYLAYRAALYFWNRTPKPPRTPSQPALHKPPAQKPAPRSQDQRSHAKGSGAPAAPRKPPAQKPTAPTSSHSDSPTPAVPTAPPKPQEERGSQKAALPIPTITFTPASPRSDSKRKTLPKPEEKKVDTPTAQSTSPSAKQQALLNKANSEAKVLIEKADRLTNEMFLTATRINVKVKITYLPKKELEAQSKEAKSTPKESEVISTMILINSTYIYKFPKDMIPIVQTGMKIKYPITEKTSFFWIFLSFNNSKTSLLPFDYLPTETLGLLNKKTTILKIETPEKVFEIEFFKAGSQAVGKCLKKVDTCKKVESVQAKFAMLPLNFKNDPGDVVSQTMVALTMDNCYVKPFEADQTS